MAGLPAAAALLVTVVQRRPQRHRAAHGTEAQQQEDGCLQERRHWNRPISAPVGVEVMSPIGQRTKTTGLTS